MHVKYVGRATGGVTILSGLFVPHGGVVEVDDATGESLTLQVNEWVKVSADDHTPAKNASTETWVAYAASLGYPVSGKTRDELIALVESGSPADTQPDPQGV